MTGPVNGTLATLSIDWDKQSDGFGEPMLEEKGAYVFGRADGEDLEEEHVKECIETFVCDFFLEDAST